MKSKIEMNVRISSNDRWDISKVRRINFFIGPNNSGKSRLLRSFADKNSKLIFDLKPASIESISDLLLEYFNTHGVFDLLNNRSDGMQTSLAKFLKENKSKPMSFEYFVSEAYFAFTEIKFNYQNSGAIQFSNNLNEFINRNVGVGKIDLYKEINSGNYFEIVYIPILRGLRPLADSSDCFEKRTLNDYFSDNKENNVRVYSGLKLYQDLRSHLLGTHEKRDKIKKFESFLSESFFSGQGITLIPMEGSDVIYVKEGNKSDYPIYALGDGIQSLIILTYAIFTATKPTIFLIEEPEQHLHAGLQRKLIETILKRNDNNLYFITTHSNNFLDIAQESDEISIQHIHPSEENSLPIANPQDEFSEILNNLGVRASSVLLANCSIWVEGVTDKLYLRVFLKKYIQTIKEQGIHKSSILESFFENLHYTFIEYQGSNVTHWDFSNNEPETDIQTPARKIARKIFLIADLDIQNKNERVTNLQSQLGVDFFLLPFKEIENLIPVDIIKKTAEARWKTFNNKGDCYLDSDKITKIAAKFRVKNNGIGHILESCISKPVDKNRQFFKEKSGTIKDKLKFCQTAIEIMENSNDWALDDELFNLCEKISNFIIASNNISL